MLYKKLKISVSDCTGKRLDDDSKFLLPCILPTFTTQKAVLKANMWKDPVLLCIRGWHKPAKGHKKNNWEPCYGYAKTGNIHTHWRIKYTVALIETKNVKLPQSH